MNIQNQHLSNFSKDLLREKNLKLPNNNTKLVAHHCNVENYLISLPLLQFLIKNGVEVDKIHKLIKFKQGFYLKQFIDENIRMREAATNPFIKNALKLINNAIYGRTLLNPLNYATQAKICHDGNSSNMIRSFSKPTFRKVDIINDDRFLVTYNRSSAKASSLYMLVTAYLIMQNYICIGFGTLQLFLHMVKERSLSIATPIPL